MPEFRISSAVLGELSRYQGVQILDGDELSGLRIADRNVELLLEIRQQFN